jgi:flagellar basal body rod protein FlgG
LQELQQTLETTAANVANLKTSANAFKTDVASFQRLSVDPSFITDRISSQSSSVAKTTQAVSSLLTERSEQAEQWSLFIRSKGFLEEVTRNIQLKLRLNMPAVVDSVGTLEQALAALQVGTMILNTNI